MDLTAQLFSGPQVAKIAGVSTSTLQSWLTRYDPEDENHRPAGAGRQGHRRFYNYHNVMHFSLTAVLFPMLRSTEMALNAGAMFAHVGSQEIEGYRREAGKPFNDPDNNVETMLCASEKGTCTVPRFQNFDWWGYTQMLLGRTEGGVLCLPVDRLWMDICWKMDLPPNKVREAVAA